MSALLERTRARKPAGFVLPKERAQVNLLPPDVRAARGLRVLRRRLLGVVVLAIVAAGLVQALVLAQAADARAELEAARQETARLQAEQTQYAEVPVVLDRLAATKDARELVMSTEVLWKSYYDAITTVLPEGVSVDALTGTVPSVMTGAPSAGGPLQDPFVGQITFVGRSLALPDPAAWLDALDSVPGLGDAWASSATLTAAEDGTVYYAVNVTVQVRETAFAGRFAQTEEVQ